MELKQLRYFVVCADVKSFSSAAEILYTTQPNVSKVIRTLEKELGFPLFTRIRTGIELTAKGRYVYEHASRALNDIDQMSLLLKANTMEELLISSNPSSWMASCFAQFYNTYANENVRFQLYSANVADIIVRISNYRDEIGFVYVMKNQNTSFQYALEKNQLMFVPLETTHAVLYFGEKHPQYAEDGLEAIDLQEIELVQNYADELNPVNYWNLKDKNGTDLKGLKVKVVTNSDCVIEQLLETTRLANISSSYVNDDVNQRNFRGISITEKGNQICFGYIKRKDVELSMWAERYVEHVKNQIRKI